MPHGGNKSKKVAACYSWQGKDTAAETDVSVCSLCSWSLEAGTSTSSMAMWHSQRESPIQTGGTLATAAPHAFPKQIDSLTC